jgi:hypothetical protein
VRDAAAAVGIQRVGKPPTSPVDGRGSPSAWLARRPAVFGSIVGTDRRSQEPFTVTTENRCIICSRRVHEPVRAHPMRTEIGHGSGPTSAKSFLSRVERGPQTFPAGQILPEAPRLLETARADRAPLRWDLSLGSGVSRREGGTTNRE